MIDMKMQKDKNGGVDRCCVGTCCASAGVAAFLALTGMALLLLGPAHVLFYAGGHFRVGVIVGRDHRGFLRSSQAAVADIGRSIGRLGSLELRPPNIRLEVSEFGGEMRAAATSLEELYRAGVRTFVVGTHLSEEELREVCESADDLPDPCTVVVTQSVNFASRSCAAADFNSTVYAAALAALIDQFNLKEKSQFVVPVVSSREEHVQFFEQFRRAAKRFPNVKLTLPVWYDPSPYPKTDALKVVSDVGSRLGLVPSAQLLFLSPELLPHVVDTALGVRRSPILKTRRWIVNALAGSREEEELINNEEYAKFCRRARLTTVNLLADDDGERNLELRRMALNGSRDLDSLAHYEEALAYETVMHLHRALTKSLVRKLPSALDSWAEESYFAAAGRERRSGLLAVNVFAEDVEGVGVRHVPVSNWEVQKVMRVQGGNVGGVENVKKHSLIRSDIENLARTSKNCLVEKVSVALDKSIFVSETSHSYDIAHFPAMVAFPVHRGIQVTLACKDKASSLQYSCLPSQVNQDSLTCLASSSNRHGLIRRPIAARRHRRSEEGEARQEEEEEEFNLWVEMRDLFRATLVAWKDMLPGIIGCSVSITGCDYCMYFLSTYNVTAPPAACIGSCSLGTFGSCSSAVMAALETTVLKDAFE